MTIYTAQWCFQGPTGDADDRFCNAWHISSDTDFSTPDFDAVTPASSPGTLGSEVRQAFWNFYNSINDADYFSAVLNNPGATFKVYSLADTPPRPAKVDYTWATSPFGSTLASYSYPAEVAICLSFEGIREGGTNRARRRGRAYLGPLAASVGSQGFKTAAVRLDPFVGDGILGFYETMVARLNALGFYHGIYSPTDNLFTIARTAWVDNSFDTQRRRGADSTGRSVTTVVQDAS